MENGMRWIFSAFALLLFFPTLTLAADKELFDKVNVTRVEKDIDAPNFSLKSLDGEQTSLKEFRGKVVFLNFWATWCGPCKSEVEDIDKLHEALGGEDFVVMAVDIRENSKKVRAFMEKHGIDFPAYLDEKGSVSSEYGVSGIPTTFLINPDGKIAGWAVGPRPWASEGSVSLMRSLMKQ
jgi:peroxiredoxin